MKLITAILLLASGLSALNQMSVPFRPGAGDTLTYARYNSNNDTAAAYINKVVDTVNRNVPRYTQNTYTHNLIMPFLRLDTLRSNVNIDSISGNPRIDTLSCDSLRIKSKWLSYDTGSFSCTFNALSDVYYYNPSYSDSVGTVYWERIGKTISVKIVDISLACSTSANIGEISLAGWPDSLTPSGTYALSAYVPIAAPQTNCTNLSIRFPNDLGGARIVFGNSYQDTPIVILEELLFTFRK